jgi:hypothetical protein
MKVLDGSLKEEVYESDESSSRIKLCKTTIINTNSISYIDNIKGYHKVSSDNVNTASIHVYSPKYYIYNVYKE